MAHKNYFEFSANSNYELGFQMGRKFSVDAKKSIKSLKTNGVDNHGITPKQLLEMSNKYFPQYAEEIKGYADGAGVDFLDLWTVSLEYDTELLGTHDRCTNIVTNYGKLIGHNEDAGFGLENSCCLVKKTLKGLTTLEIYFYNTLGGSTVGVTSNGYAHAINTILFTDFKLGVPKSVLTRYIFETENPDKTIEEIIKLPRTSGYNHNIISKKGKIWNLELTSDNGVLTNPPSPFCHSNHCLNIRTDVNDEFGTLSRLKVAKKNTRAKMKVDELIKLQNDASEGPDKSIFNERTVGKMIIDFDNMMSKVWLLRENDLGWVDYELDFVR